MAFGKAGLPTTDLKELLDEFPMRAGTFIAFEKLPLGETAAADFTDAIDDFSDPIREGGRHAFKENGLHIAGQP